MVWLLTRVQVLFFCTFGTHQLSPIYQRNRRIRETDSQTLVTDLANYSTPFTIKCNWARIYFGDFIMIFTSYQWLGTIQTKLSMFATGIHYLKYDFFLILSVLKVFVRFYLNPLCRVQYYNTYSISVIALNRVCSKNKKIQIFNEFHRQIYPICRGVHSLVWTVYKIYAKPNQLFNFEK